MTQVSITKMKNCILTTYQGELYVHDILPSCVHRKSLNNRQNTLGSNSIFLTKFQGKSFSTTAFQILNMKSFSIRRFNNPKIS